MNKDEFLNSPANWDNHRNLLWPALECTKRKVVEFGVGDGSTPYLHDYCKSKGRELISYENNEEWFKKFKHYKSKTHQLVLVQQWSDIEIDDIGVLLIDHAPGERRKEDIKKFADKAWIIVCHDTEQAADHGYQMRAELAKFKYKLDYKSEGAWATVVSNFIDVSKFKV